MSGDLLLLSELRPDLLPVIRAQHLPSDDPIRLAPNGHAQFLAGRPLPIDDIPKERVRRAAPRREGVALSDGDDHQEFFEFVHARKATPFSEANQHHSVNSPNDFTVL
ncbi:hypothetical protein [Burkholderia sp. 572]|uniref:hypothetical protein n=1 Tax=Burkholderia sp. 572 TaxID=3156414 RepID=UPI00339100DD